MTTFASRPSPDGDGTYEVVSDVVGVEGPLRPPGKLRDDATASLIAQVASRAWSQDTDWAKGVRRPVIATLASQAAAVELADALNSSPAIAYSSFTGDGLDVVADQADATIDPVVLRRARYFAEGYGQGRTRASSVRPPST